MKKNIQKIVRVIIKKEEGMTLIETVVVLVVAGFILASSSVFMKTNVESYVTIKDSKEYLQSARIGFNMMIAEMNRIEESLQIDEGDYSSIQFDLPDVSNIDYAYSSSESALMREGVVLVSGVYSFYLEYYDDDGYPIYNFSGSEDVWSIKVTMIVGGGDQQYTFSSYVHPRNFQYN